MLNLLSRAGHFFLPLTSLTDNFASDCTLFSFKWAYLLHESVSFKRDKHDHLRAFTILLPFLLMLPSFSKHFPLLPASNTRQSNQSLCYIVRIRGHKILLIHLLHLLKTEAYHLRNQLIIQRHVTSRENKAVAELMQFG